MGARRHAALGFRVGRLPLVNRAAVAGYKLNADGTAPFDAGTLFHHRGQVEGREMRLLKMKAEQTALATRRIEALWRTAWPQGHGAEGTHQ